MHSSDPFVPTWWTMAPARAPILTGWAGGHAADALLAEGNESMIDRGLDAMASAFGMRRRDHDALLVATHSHDWQADPFSRGANSYAGAERTRTRRWHDRSAAFSSSPAKRRAANRPARWRGAIDSGHRAAKEILRAMSSRA